MRKCAQSDGQAALPVAGRCRQVAPVLPQADPGWVWQFSCEGIRHKRRILVGSRPWNMRYLTTGVCHRDPNLPVSKPVWMPRGLAILAKSCVISGKLLNLSGPQFAHL